MDIKRSSFHIFRDEIQNHLFPTSSFHSENCAAWPTTKPVVRVFSDCLEYLCSQCLNPRVPLDFTGHS